MLSADRDALICDLAEVYGIFNYRALPASLLATLAVGLRDNSRIKMSLSGVKVPRSEMLLAAALDRLSFLAWAITEDGANGRNRPTSILNTILGKNRTQSGNIVAFDTPEKFEKAWAKLTGVDHG